MTQQIVQLRGSMEESANDLNQICSTMEILLDSMYEESETANPLREALALLWRNALGVRDRLFGNCIDVDSWKSMTEAQNKVNHMYLLNDSGYGCGIL